MNDKITTGNKIYLFYLTFWALLGLFPVMTDYFLQTYGTDWYLFAPHPTEITGIIIYAAGSTIISLLIIHFSLKYNKTDKLEYLSICVFRYALAFAMIIFYGYGKLVTKQFQINYLSLETPMKDVSSAQLTWYFFGRSNFETFLYGLFEFIPGVLLLFRRTTLIGAITLFPVLLNVLLVNIFNQIEGGHTYTFSVAFLSFNFGLFLYYRKELSLLFKTAKTKMQRAFTSRPSKIILNLLKIVFILLIFIKFGKGIYIASTTGTQLSKVKSKCFGIYQLQNISYNTVSQSLDSLKNYWKKLYFEKREYWNFKLKDKRDSIIYMKYTFFQNKDSIRITAYSKFDENENPIDSTVFTGTYFLTNNDSIMTMKGIKNDTLINAVYKKLPIDGHDWWW